MSNIPSTQELRSAVQLIKPELLAQVPPSYNKRQAFNFLRHNATNYDALLDSHRQKYGTVSPAEHKAFVQGSADLIIDALRLENDDLLQGKTNTKFAKFLKKVRVFLKLEDDIDLEGIHKAVQSLRLSQSMYKSWNDRYRRQRALVLNLIKSEAPDLYGQVLEIYKANSDSTLNKLEGKNND